MHSAFILFVYAGLTRLLIASGLDTRASSLLVRLLRTRTTGTVAMLKESRNEIAKLARCRVHDGPTYSFKKKWFKIFVIASIIILVVATAARNLMKISNLARKLLGTFRPPTYARSCLQASFSWSLLLYEMTTLEVEAFWEPTNSYCKTRNATKAKKKKKTVRLYSWKHCAFSARTGAEKEGQKLFAMYKKYG